MRPPDLPLRCLLVEPRFSEGLFWGLGEVLRAVGARAAMPPLGLLTAAALLPQQWAFRLVDLNVRDLVEDDWAAIDIVCVGGILVQQQGIRNLIREARARGRFVVVGGPEATSRPALYKDADARVLGEGECSIPLWLASWRAGRPRGVFVADSRPDITSSPVPRFDLVDFHDYLQVSLQYSRGCLFSCEFCEVIELYGRSLRTKAVEQVLCELDTLYDLGCRGWVMIADDNLIANRAHTRTLLEALESWGGRKGYPFRFFAQVTVNLGDDAELLDLMRRAGVCLVFVGIETPSAAVLRRTGKAVNAMRPLADRVHRIHEHGIGVTAGFIIGFDGEERGADEALIACIEETGIAVALVQLLTALPNTRFWKRLCHEGRLIASNGASDPVGGTPASVVQPAVADLMADGLNFVTLRDRREILEEYRHVIETIYSPDAFLDRVLTAASRLGAGRPRIPSWPERRRQLRTLWRTMWRMTAVSGARWGYWRNFVRTLAMGPASFEYAQAMAAFCLHGLMVSERVQRELVRRIEPEGHPVAGSTDVVPIPGREVERCLSVTVSSR